MTQSYNQVKIWSSTGDHEVLIQKYKIRSQGSVAWVTWPSFKFWDPPNISGTAESTNLKFYMQIDGKGY